MTRWHYRDAALLWLYPPAFAAHVAEELLAGEGLRRWLARLAGGTLSLQAFLTLNAIGFVVIAAAAIAASRREAAGWAAVGLATLLAVNALLHVLGTVATGTYSPGLITAVVLYVPLGSLVLLRAVSQADCRTLAIGTLAGLGAQALVSAIALSAVK